MPATATPEAGLRDRLKSIRANIDPLRDELKEAGEEQAAAQAAYAGLENVVPGSPEFQAARDATARVGALKDQIDAWQHEERDVLEMLGQRAEPISGNGNQAGPDREAPTQGWDSAHLFTPEMAAMLSGLAHSKGRFGGIELGEVASRDTFAADVAPTSNMRRGEYYGIVPQLIRPLRILDLIPTGTMDQNTLPYTQESGALTGAAETAEGSTKPEGAVTYTDQTATAQTIAAWLKIKRQALDDVPALRAIIDARLRYMVQRRLEAEVLNGDGSDPNIRGILNTSGIGTTAAGTNALPADRLLDAITAILLADGYADGIAIHPTNWASIIKVKADGDGHYYSGGPFSMTPQVVWGIPLIPSPAVTLNHAIVGDWSIGAQLFIREGVNVKMSDSDQDDFIKNRLTLLGEMRAALAVWRPALFNDVDMT